MFQLHRECKMNSSGHCASNTLFKSDYLYICLCLSYLVCCVSNFSLRRGTACYSLYCDLSGVHRVRPKGSTGCHCCSVTGPTEAGRSDVCYAEFSLLLCAEALVLRSVRGLKGTNRFFFFNLIKSSSGGPDVKEHEIRNVLTPVPVKRSYLCSRGLQILFFFLECFPPSHDVIMHAELVSASVWTLTE